MELSICECRVRIVTISVTEDLPSLRNLTTCATFAGFVASQATRQEALRNFQSPCYTGSVRFSIFLPDHNGLIIYSSLGRT